MSATIAVTRERRAGETRVAATPDSVKKLAVLGFKVVIETGAGMAAAYPDAEYESVGAAVAPSAEAALAGVDLSLKVRAPEQAEIAALKPGALLVAMLDPYGARERLRRPRCS